MPTKKCQKLTFKLVSKTKDFFGVWEICICINDKYYTYPINSEFAVEEVERLISKHRFGKALQTLKQFKTNNFNSFEKEKQNDANSRYV